MSVYACILGRTYFEERSIHLIALQLSAVKDEFPSEGLRVFNEEHPAPK